MSPPNAMEDFQRTIDYAIKAGDDGRMILSSRLRDRFHDIEVEIVAAIHETLLGTCAGYPRP